MLADVESHVLMMPLVHLCLEFLRALLRIVGVDQPIVLKNRLESFAGMKSYRVFMCRSTAHEDDECPIGHHITSTFDFVGGAPRSRIRSRT